MAEPFISELRLFGCNFAPRGWAKCDGQILSIAQNTALFSLLGTTYGGNGQTTFALPDLRGRVPIHTGQGAGLSDRTLGEVLGSESVTLTVAQLRSHAHGFGCAETNANSREAGGNVPAIAKDYRYRANDNHSAMHAGTISTTGGSQPHDNMQPYL